MPAKSKAQSRFLHGVASGSIKKPGFKPEQAEEFLDATKTSYDKLPEEVKPKRFKKLFKTKP